MTHSPDQGQSDLPQRLATQLAQLEARGRRHLLSALRRQALDGALNWALPCTVVVPLFWLLTPAWIGAWWPAVAIAAVLVPALVVCAAYALTRSRQHVSRHDALAFLDQTFALKDRLTASAAQLATPRRDGFAQAALLEAAPWVQQALTLGLDAPPTAMPGALRRRWHFLPAALLLVVVAGWLQWRMGEVLPSADAVASLAGHDTSSLTPPGVAASGNGVPQTRPGAGQRPDTDIGHGAAARSEREDGSKASASAAAPGSLSAAATAESTAQQAAGGARPSPSVAAMTAATGTAGAPLPPSVSRSVTMGAEPTPPSPSQHTEASPPSGSQDDADNASASAESRAQGRQEAPSQRGSQPPAAEKSPQSSKNGQPQGDSRSKGGQDSQNDGKGSGEGQNNGSRKGQDSGPKAGRGFATLMLARPMRDQVLGQTNAGPVSSVLQQSRSQGGPTTVVQAQDRGRLAEGAAVQPANPQGAQERVLLRQYFARDAQAPAAIPVPSDGTDNNPKATR